MLTIVVNEDDTSPLYGMIPVLFDAVLEFGPERAEMSYTIHPKHAAGGVNLCCAPTYDDELLGVRWHPF